MQVLQGSEGLQTGTHNLQIEMDKMVLIVFPDYRLWIQQDKLLKSSTARDVIVVCCLPPAGSHGITMETIGTVQ